MLELLEAVLYSTLDFAPALVLAALGAVVSERSGVVNVGVEGMMRVGAFVAAVAALGGSTWLGVGAGALAGAGLGAVHALLCLRFRADQVVSGMAINLVALAGITFLLETHYGPNGTPPIEQLGRLRFADEVPLLRALSGHTALTWIALAAPFALHGLFTRSALGLRIRAVGEKPLAAATVGLRVFALRAGCVCASGALAGLAGAALSTATLDRFEHNMPAGLGFMAVAAMVFGRWTPLGAFGAALFFSTANALRIGLVTSAPGVLQVIPQGALLALPYALTLALLALPSRGTHAPAALGQPYRPESR